MGKTALDKFLTNIWVTLIARATLLLMPLVVSFVTWFTWEVYSRMETAIKQHSAALTEIQKQLQDHEFRLGAGNSARLDFQTHALERYQRFDEQLENIKEKLIETNNAVIKIQTIIENRLPSNQKDTRLWPQQ